MNFEKPAGAPSEEKEGKILEFKRKVKEEETPKGIELKERVELKISGEDLYQILIGLTKERQGLDAQLAEIQADPDLYETMGGMVEGLIARNKELMERLSAHDPFLQGHFKKVIEG